MDRSPQGASDRQGKPSDVGLVRLVALVLGVFGIPPPFDGFIPGGYPTGTWTRLIGLKGQSVQGHDWIWCDKPGGTGRTPGIVASHRDRATMTSVISQVGQGHTWYREKPSGQGLHGELESSRYKATTGFGGINQVGQGAQLLSL